MEAITRKKEVDEMKIMTKEFPRISVNKVGPLFSSDTTDGWRQVSAGGGTWISSTYFDLAGLAIDDKTLFFSGAIVQEVLNPTSVPSTAGNGLLIGDIMSTTPLTDAEVELFLVYGNTAQGGAINFEETVFGRVRFFNVDIDNAAGGYMIKVFDNQLGSLDATATDRIYCYRVVGFQGTMTDGVHSVWPARYVLSADAIEEPEHVYLMRLKRSYDLQQRLDRD